MELSPIWTFAITTLQPIILFNKICINNIYKRFEINHPNKYLDVLSFLQRIIIFVEDNSDN